MKQKETLLWILAVSGLVISLLSLSIQVRLHGVQSFAKAPNLKKAALATSVAGTAVIYQGPAGCAQWEHGVQALLTDPDFAGTGGKLLDSIITDYANSCGSVSSAFCQALDQAGAKAQSVVNNNAAHGVVNGIDADWRDHLFLAYNSFCRGGGGGTDHGTSTTYTGSGGDTCTSSDPNVHSYLECKAAELR